MVDTAVRNARTFVLEWLQGPHSDQLSQLQAFIGSPDGHASTRWAHPASNWTALVTNAEDLLKSINISGQSKGGDCSADPATPRPSCRQRTSAQCEAGAALATLAAAGERQRPVAALAAHGSEGGATVLSRLLAQACRTQPLVWSRCAFRDGYDGCDPEEVDICVQRQGRFSAGRFASRGYRFVHIVRNPLELLTRSYLLMDPNATHNMNATVLLAGLEAHWKLLTSGLLHEMVDVAESHAADPQAMQIPFESMLSDTLGNETIVRMLAFMLDRSPLDRSIQELATALSHVLSTNAKTEIQGDAQRKHLAKLFMRKPAKCNHVNKLQAALGYETVRCLVEPKPPPPPAARRRRLQQLRFKLSTVRRRQAPTQQYLLHHEHRGSPALHE